MYYDTLPNEIIVHVFFSLPDVTSVLSLAATCQRFHNVFHSSQKLAILASAADAELGPLDEIVQLLTHNASQPAHIRRQVPISEALLKQCIHVGRTAQRYEEIYPTKKWKEDFANRRMLHPAERLALRRALYRLWLYTSAFHNAAHVRYNRMVPAVLRERCHLLHNYSPSEIADMLDVHEIMRDLIANNICPSNGKVRQRHRKRFPDSLTCGQQSLFGVRSSYAPPMIWTGSFPPSFQPPHSTQMQIAQSYQDDHKFKRYQEPDAEGWGDETSHYYVVEDMMKLDPAQILFLRDTCPYKSQVETHVWGLGEWFNNNGQTFSETAAYVCHQRGDDVEEVKDKVFRCEWGIARSEV